MAIDLTGPAGEVSLAASSAHRSLFEKLQANILKPHGRNVERHLFLKFTGDPAAVRAWIRDSLSKRLYTAAHQYDDARRRAADSSFDGGCVTLFHLSADGYRYLGFNPQRFESKAFRKSMKDQGDGLLDDFFSTGNKDPKPHRWEQTYRDAVHALIQLGDDPEDELRLINNVETIKAEVASFAVVLGIETGRALRRTVDKGLPTERVEPIEHFGYFDGISQPLFTREDLENYHNRDKKGTRGAGKWDPSASLSLVLVDDPFTGEENAFGSYLVYRKLHQNVGLWVERVKATATAIGHTVNLAGAMAVGRFKDGTPVVDFEAPASEYTNDFAFKVLDPKGFRCPAHAHVRKVNPRGTTPSTSDTSERGRRIARRGIPYGKPMPGVCDALDTDPDPAAQRGLLFMCFQSNVEKQFEFIQRTWVDNPNFPDNVFNLPFQDDTGDDPLIGQDLNEKQRWPKKWGDTNAGRNKVNFESAVTLKGGEYFFAPSVPFLENI
jgi:Dyp-type peroxidase family